jgi:tryptophan synthase beta subunit
METFGGAYIPEMLFPNVEELRSRYLDIINEASFQKRFKAIAARLCRPTHSVILCGTAKRKN